jgi:hypothetical protein
MSNLSVANDKGTIQTTGPSTVHLAQVAITGGTVSSVAGSTISVDQSSSISGATFNSAGGLNVAQNATLTLNNDVLTLAGATINGTLSTNTNLTLTGGATVQILGTLSVTGTGGGA